MISNINKHRERSKQSGSFFLPKPSWWQSSGDPEQVGLVRNQNRHQKKKKK